MGVAGELRAGHGVTAEEGDACGPGHGKGPLADGALHSACVNDDGVGAHEVRVGLEPVGAGLGVAGEDDELAGGNDLVGEPACTHVDGGEADDVRVLVEGVDLAAPTGERPRERAADEAKAYDADAALRDAHASAPPR